MRGHHASVQDTYRRNERCLAQQGAASWCREKCTGLGVVEVELEEIVRQIRIEYRVLGIHPLAVHDVGVAQNRPELMTIAIRPTLEQGELLFSRSADKIMAAA